MIELVLATGEPKNNRTGVTTASVFGHQYHADLRQGFPLLTTKKVKFDLVVKELLWFLRGETNINTLGCKIWDEWADANGDCGPIYGKQWIKWSATNEDDTFCGQPWTEHINQIQQAIDTIKNNPDSRRIIVSAWNVTDLPKMRLAPCHCFFQFNVYENCLDLQLYQRSADLALGVPFNIASYALLLSMVAKECDKVPRYFIHTFGDLHIYNNHIEGLEEQLKREPYPLPTLKIKDKPFWEIKEEDIQLENYKHHPYIKFSVAV